LEVHKYLRSGFWGKLLEGNLDGTHINNRPFLGIQTKHIAYLSKFWGHLRQIIDSKFRILIIGLLFYTLSCFRFRSIPIDH
jgi:hypothetical protein